MSNNVSTITVTSHLPWRERWIKEFLAYSVSKGYSAHMTKTIPALCSKYLNTGEDFKQAINTFVIHPTMEFIIIEAILQYIPRENQSEKKIRSRLWFIYNFNPPELISLLLFFSNYRSPTRSTSSKLKLPCGHYHYLSYHICDQCLWNNLYQNSWVQRHPNPFIIPHTWIYP